MRKPLKSVLLSMSFVFSSVLFTPAFAKCRIYGNPWWSVNRSIGADVPYIVHDFCNIWYTNTGTSFTSLRAINEPKNGKLTKTGPFRWYYKANKGFTGHDKFVVELCGDDGRLKGCAVLNYDMEVVGKPFD